MHLCDGVPHPPNCCTSEVNSTLLWQLHWWTSLLLHYYKSIFSLSSLLHLPFKSTQARWAITNIRTVCAESLNPVCAVATATGRLTQTARFITWEGTTHTAANMSHLEDLRRWDCKLKQMKSIHQSHQSPDKYRSLYCKKALMQTLKNAKNGQWKCTG